MRHKLVMKQKNITGIAKDTSMVKSKEHHKVQQDGETMNDMTLYENCAVQVMMDKKRPKTYARCLMDM